MLKNNLKKIIQKFKTLNWSDPSLSVLELAQKLLIFESIITSHITGS